MATSIKISQLPAKGSNLEATDLLEVSEFNGTGYVSKSITGAEIVASVPPTSVEWGDIGGTLSSQTDLNTALNGKVPTTRTLTINGTTQDLSADRTFTISTGITIGTTAITSGTVGRVLFEGTGNVVSESANLFWDNTNGRLGIGTSSPTTIVHINGNTAGTAPSLQIRQQTNTTPTWFAVRNNDNLASTGAISLDIGISGGASQFFNGTAQGDIVLKAYSKDNTSKFFLGATSGSTAQMVLFPSTGNVGINTTTDAGYKLDVNGTARVQGGLSSTANISAGGALVSTGDVACGNKIYNNNFYVENTGATNIGSGQSNAPASAILCASSTTRGFLPPRMTTTQKNAIATPAAGLEVFDSTTLTPSIYNGTNWQNALVPNSNGNVLINTTTDAGFKLDVNGTARVNTLTIGLGGGQLAQNTAIGYQALAVNTTGSTLVALGYQSLVYNTTGNNNTAIGNQTLFSNTTGNNNTAIGRNAGYLNTTGSQNIVIGAFSGTGNFSNTTILGYNDTATADNQMRFGSAQTNNGAVTTEVNASTQVWNVIINGVARKILLA